MIFLLNANFIFMMKKYKVGVMAVFLIVFFSLGTAYLLAELLGSYKTFKSLSGLSHDEKRAFLTGAHYAYAALYKKTM